MDIQFIQIEKQFGGQSVFHNFNISFPEGRISCLMGPSGVGKSTLLNLIMGLVRPDAGKILGMEGRQIAAVFQEDRLIGHWDAVKNIKLVCEGEITEERIITELDKVLMKDYEKKPVRKLSGGMCRRVAIVRALLAKSDLVILDEPFRGLDESLKKTVADYIKCMTEKKTVIVVTHDDHDVTLLEAGKIVIR